MIEKGRAYSPTWNGRPPGMSRNDRTIWDIWRKTIQQLKVKIYYNVRIGETPKILSRELNRYRMVWWRLCCRRIDVLMSTTQRDYIVEVRWNATESGVARLMIYRDLLRKERKRPLKIQTLLLTNQANKELLNLCTENEIDLLVLNKY